MLIINADDFGIGEKATGNILACYQRDRITSTSAMMFMVDSERAAKLALDASIDVGLHLNLSSPFSGRTLSRRLQEYQSKIVTFLEGGKYHFLLYNRALKQQFGYVCQAQYEEFTRLYNKLPTHIDGHHHMHLCMNILIDKLIPRGAKVRRNFSFSKGEKSFLNRLYRRIIDRSLMKRFVCTDFFFSVSSPRSEIVQGVSLRGIANLAGSQNVELMVHPERKTEYDYLMGDEFLRIVAAVKRGSYASL